ncbi:proton-coupled folate transporter-like isoform X2 [Microplitis mediator]|uniref:proton-coupled folate transporter-like isoform X2 n=1 Tax=Microplitis mediator TaxID=375433 RepID=UPI002552C80D|nr:proton-coupled folate transporter-like isoform X2 [Microplitis mediator]XP_057320088.1 proton-coupled folate transporter-like isoform X2 [Microplitis mediator]XP_057320089.1 proton-coupled folate transporter-like isoform X2 [Microplitis mediator]
MDDENTNLEKTGWRRYVLMEPPIFLSLLAMGMTNNVLTDLIIFQTCRLEMATNKTSCDILHTNSSSQEARDLNKIIQPHASYIIMSTSLIKSILPALLILFFGPWSDKYGRKPLILIGHFVPLCKFIILCILSSFDTNPWLYLLAYVPTALLGSVLLLATTCYVSDTTHPEKRAWHLACIQACVQGGQLIGTFTGAFIFKQIGYTYLFTIAALISISSVVYVVFVVPESIKNNSNEKWGNPFNLSSVKQLVLTCTTKRDGLNRGLLWSCLIILSLFRIFNNGNTNVIYLFVKAHLGWDIVQYSMFNSLSIVIAIIGTFGGVKVMKHYIGLTDVNMIILGSLSGFSAAMCISFTTKSWHMYLEVCLGFFIGIILPTTRSLLSKSAPKDDSGKVFSLMSFLDVVLPLGSAPLYSLLYSSYLSVYPSPVYLMSSGIFILIISVSILIHLKYIKENLRFSNL